MTTMRPPAFGALAGGLAISALVGYTDIVTGELRLTTLYLAIIFGTTWLTGRSLGLLLALVDLACVIWANPLGSLAGQTVIHYLLDNLGTAVIFFACAFL